MANKNDLKKKQKEVFGDYDENFGLFGRDSRPFSQRLLESGVPFARALANYMDPNSDALKQQIFDRTKVANMTYLNNDKNLPSNTREMLIGEYDNYANKIMNDPNMTMDEKLQAMGKFDQEMKKMIDLQSDF